MKNEEWELHFRLVKREEGKIALTQLLNEECRMKNEEWELHFLILVKREKERGKNRADAMGLYGGEAIWRKWMGDANGAGYIFSIFRTAEQ